MQASSEVERRDTGGGERTRRLAEDESEKQRRETGVLRESSLLEETVRGQERGPSSLPEEPRTDNEATSEEAEEEHAANRRETGGVRR